MSWEAYYKKTAGRGLRPLLTVSLEQMGEVKEGAKALELGFGGGNESVHLLSKGFQLTAVEKNDLAVSSFANTIQELGLTADVIRSDFEDLSLPNDQFDFVFSSMSLPFIKEESFINFWKMMKASVKSNGIVAVDLFGNEDSWVKEGFCTGFADEEIENLLSEFKVLNRALRKELAPAANGVEKFWHIHSLVLRKV